MALKILLAAPNTNVYPDIESFLIVVLEMNFAGRDFVLLLPSNSQHTS